jgi:hypothetical protein
MIRSIRYLACAAVLAVAPLGTARACDYPATCCECCEYVRVTFYVCTYETRTRCVTVTDECGCPRQVPVTCTVPVRVPVTRLVKVCH